MQNRAKKKFSEDMRGEYHGKGFSPVNSRTPIPSTPTAAAQRVYEALASKAGKKQSPSSPEPPQALGESSNKANQVSNHPGLLPVVVLYLKAKR